MGKRNEEIAYACLKKSSMKKNCYALLTGPNGIRIRGTLKKVPFVVKNMNADGTEKFRWRFGDRETNSETTESPDITCDRIM